MEEIKYGEFPAIEDHTEGIIELEGDREHVRAELWPDIVYAHKSGMDLHLRIISPDHLEKPKKYPVLLYVQGSGWGPQRMCNHVIDLAPIAMAGYHVIIVQYRDSRTAPFPAQIEDTKTAMRYLMAHAEEMNLDMDRVFLGGDSSGGHTVLGCYATWYDNRLDEEKTPLVPLKAVIDLYGPVNFLTMLDQPTSVDRSGPDCREALEIGGLTIRDHVKEALNAAIDTYIHEGQKLPPLLIMHGDADRYVPLQQSVDLYKLLKSYNYDVTFIKVKGADHGGSIFFIPRIYDALIGYMKDHEQ